MSGAEVVSLALVASICLALMFGYPVALTLGGVSLGFACIGAMVGLFPLDLLGALPLRIYGIMTNETLLAIPLFIAMGVMLERTRIAEDLLETMGRLFGALPGGLGIAAVIVGVMLAAAKGVVGATAVTMGLIVLPAMMRHGYDARLASGTVAATATLAQIFPPATVLVLLGDQLSNAWQSAQLAKGNYAPAPLTIADLFAGALVPASMLVMLYLAFLVVVAFLRPDLCPAMEHTKRQDDRRAFLNQLLLSLIAPLALIALVLGTILFGLASPNEAAALGVCGAGLLALVRHESRDQTHSFWMGWLRDTLWPVLRRSADITAMIFLILIGATLFSLVFRGFGGDDLVQRLLSRMPGGIGAAILVVMLAMFLLGFVMDAFEIIFVIVPIVAPPLLASGAVDPVWLGVMMAMNLQTSYMHPPLGPTLFFLRSVAPPQITTRHIYIGIIPFVLIQLCALVLLWYVPWLATGLPKMLYGN